MIPIQISSIVKVYLHHLAIFNFYIQGVGGAISGTWIVVVNRC